ncbi:hypothetical protein ACN2C6_09430 [Caulobacter sp. ErkDOM-YI]|uniref:hypothetical protein n=1 Tax=unclassified Caulobacter TaxID=2648921 RepID=UPI003AF91DD5
MKRVLACAALLPFLLVACDNRPAAPPGAPAATAPATPPAKPTTDPAAANFQRDATLDVFGYYFTQTPVQVGNWKLKSVNMGSPSDFASWEEGKRPSNFAPFFLEFEDVTSPMAENELGQVYQTVSFRLMPDSYRVDGQAVVFRGLDPRLGQVVFSGVFDLAALKAARTAGPPGPPQIVLTGALRIGAEPMRNISFLYFAGD